MLPLKVETKMFKSHENIAEWRVPAQGREFECAVWSKSTNFQL